MKNIEEKRFEIRYGGNNRYNLYMKPLGKLSKWIGLRMYSGTISINEKLNSKDELVKSVFNTKTDARKYRINPFKYKMPDNFIFFDNRSYEEVLFLPTCAIIFLFLYLLLK